MITTLEIKNFKCFEKQKIGFRKLTILAGANSSGKSSTIQSLLLLKVALDKLGPFEHLKNNNDIISNITIPLNGKFALSLGNTQEVLKRNADEDIITLISSDAEGNDCKMRFDAPVDSDDIYNLALRSDSKFDTAFSALKGNFHYLCAERIGPRLSYDVAQQDFSHVGYNGEYAVQVLAQKKQDLIEEPEKRKFSNSEDLKVLSQVRLWMNHIIPNFYIDTAQLEGKLQKAYTTYSSSTPTNVGFGISYILPIVVTCLIAKSGSMIIIENPEAHLHPKGQSNIGYFIGKMISSNLQIVLETHSEHVINGIRRAVMPDQTKQTSDVQINFFTQQSEIENVLPILVSNTGDLSCFPRDFFDQTQQDMAELFKIQKDG